MTREDNKYLKIKLLSINFKKMLQFNNIRVNLSLDVFIQLQFNSTCSFFYLRTFSLLCRMNDAIRDPIFLIIIMMTESTPISLTWNNLGVTVQEKVILEDCHGYCKPGQMLAIMGPSGAGKTTLLSLIAKRISNSLFISGSVLANNQTFDQKKFFQFGAFVYQSDLLHQTLTVRETLQFAAILKIQDRSSALQRTDELMRQFQLQNCKQSFVGGAQIKGISGGQKKRVCIAIEMISRPKVIVLDEPTSGLDSSKAAKILRILKKMAMKGQTIIFTIHQPSYLIYSCLDRLLLLDKGRTIYQGSAALIGSYMQTLSISVPTNSTISDFFMMEISTYKKDTMNYFTPLTQENYSKHLDQGIQNQIKTIELQQLSLLMNAFYQPSFWFCFIHLFQRDWKNYWRNKMKFGAMLLNVVMRILLIGIIFYNYNPSRAMISQDPTRMFIKVQSVAFLNVASGIMTSIFAVSITLPQQRELYYKETDSKKYSALSYYMAKLIIQILSAWTGTILFASISYWLNGFTNSFNNFIVFVPILLLAAMIGNSIGFFCATLFQTVRKVSALTPIVMIPLLVLSGLFNKLNSFPAWASWLQYISPFRYGMQLIIENQYGTQKFPLPGGGLYDYKTDLGIDLSFSINFTIAVSIGLFFYAMGFVFLKTFSSKLAA